MQTGTWPAGADVCGPLACQERVTSRPVDLDEEVKPPKMVAQLAGHLPARRTRDATTGSADAPAEPPAVRGIRTGPQPVLR